MTETIRYVLEGQEGTGKLDDLVQGFIRGLYARVIDRTPIESGKLVSDWNFSKGAPNLDYEPREKGAKTTALDAKAGASSRSAKKAELDSFASTVRAGDQVFMANGQPYTYRIEHGWSGQAPTGMVQITALEAEDVLAQAKLEAGL